MTPAPKPIKSTPEEKKARMIAKAKETRQKQALRALERAKKARAKEREQVRKVKKLAKKMSTAKYWIKKLDLLTGNLVRGRDHCENQWCNFQGKGYSLQWAHIVSRRYHNTRWDLENAFCLCAGCHKYYTDRPLEWEAFVESVIGVEEYHALKQRALSNNKPDYQAIYESMKELT